MYALANRRQDDKKYCKFIIFFYSCSLSVCGFAQYGTYIVSRGRRSPLLRWDRLLSLPASFGDVFDLIDSHLFRLLDFCGCW